MDSTNSNFYFVINDRNIILKEDGSLLSEKDFLQLKTLNPSADYYIEESNHLHILGVDQPELSDGCVESTLRQFFAEREEHLSFLAARSKALLSWRKNTQFCGKCGHPLEDHKQLTARYCSHCETTHFPRIEPCIIVLVHKGDKVLLARHAQRNQDVYSCLAGFMEAGESAEHCVFREVLEETGIRVKNISYRGSQSWPFPSQLMLAFRAEYESGEIKVQEDELLAAQWFNPDNCPATPRPGSIAWKLIHGTI